MPFVNEEHRKHPDIDVPGDRCYMCYRAMMFAWKQEPRWTTVDRIATVIWPEPWYRAQILAFLVFFALIVMPYELMKRSENGDI